MAGLRALPPVALTLVALALAPPLHAAGGGGGGSLPSSTAPSYDPAAEYQKGVAALEAQRFAEAKRAFDRVIAAAPRDANTQYMAGLARVGLDDWKGARRFFERAVKLEPDLVRAREQLGVTLAKLGERPEAEAELAALQARASACADACPQAGELKSAIGAVTAALAGAPTARLNLRDSLLFASAAAGDGAYLDAVALINERRYEAAIASLEAARHAFGPHPDVLTYLGFANRKLGRFDAAESYYRQALAAAPGHRGATEYFGELMVERGDMAGARAMLAQLEAQCRFGCAEADELRRWIDAGRSPRS
jgi:tetratricopeptide (TPR) repeat protein